MQQYPIYIHFMYIHSMNNFTILQSSTPVSGYLPSCIPPSLHSRSSSLHSRSTSLHSRSTSLHSRSTSLHTEQVLSHCIILHQTIQKNKLNKNTPEGFVPLQSVRLRQACWSLLLAARQ